MLQHPFHKLKKNRSQNGHTASSNLALNAGVCYNFPNLNRHLRTSRAGCLPLNLNIQAFAVLHEERLYLLNCLQCENSKSIDILRKISALEERLMLGTASLGRRGTKNKLARLKYRRKETDRQEQAILAHLGRLSFEIQSLDRWMLVEAERHDGLRYVELSPGKRNPQKSVPPNESQRGKEFFSPIEKPESKPESHSWLSLDVVEEAEQAIGIPGLDAKSKIRRSSSMESVELALMQTGSSFESRLLNKRNSF